MSFRLCLAPIKGVTDAAYRRSFVKFFKGFDFAVTPFIKTQKGSFKKPGILRELNPEKNKGIKIVPQLLSKEPDEFIHCCNELFGMGFETVNLNLGCPSRMVINKMRGSGLLPNPEFVDSFLEKVIPKIECKLSIKMRLGKTDESEIFKILPVMNKYPLSEIIIHPRTAKQMYDGEILLDTFESAIKETNHKIVYSGDINSVEDFNVLTKRFKSIDNWMIGRGALRNPFLPAMIKQQKIPDERKQVEMIIAFHDLLLTEYKTDYSGPAHILGKMKAIWFYLAHSFPDGEKFLKRVNSSKGLRRYRWVINRFFNERIESLQ